MAHADADAEPLQRAPQVCSHCKSIKKGCDKKLPSCSQCIKRRAVCRYGEPDEPRGSRSGRTSTDVSPGREFASTWTSIPRSVRARLCPATRLSLLLLNSLSEALPSNALDTKAPQSPKAGDSVLAAQICYITRSDGKYLHEVVAQYFQGVHSWLPIISRRRFYHRLGQFESRPTPDFSILVLVMRLIALHPSPDPDVDQDREVLYLASKSLFAQVQAFVSSSLYLVQAGVLLARYEQAHGLTEAAYVTVGTTAMMANAMGLYNKQCSMELQGSDEWLEDEEALCTWWGLLIADRIIASDINTTKKPLATRPIREDDYLPLESDELERHNNNLLNPTFRYFVSATSLPGVGTFGREAQATFLLEKAQNALDGGETVQWNLCTLGPEVHGLLSTVMEQIAGRWGIYCGAMQMMIIALYTLHSLALLQRSFPTRPDLKVAANTGINTITRMMIDIAYAFNRETHLNIDALSPANQHIVRCAQQHIMSAVDLRDAQWRNDYEQLRKMLNCFARRWGNSGVELGRLDGLVEGMITNVNTVEGGMGSGMDL